MTCGVQRGTCTDAAFGALTCKDCTTIVTQETDKENKRHWDRISKQVREFVCLLPEAPAGKDVVRYCQRGYIDCTLFRGRGWHRYDARALLLFTLLNFGSRTVFILLSMFYDAAGDGGPIEVCTEGVWRVLHLSQRRGNNL